MLLLFLLILLLLQREANVTTPWVLHARPSAVPWAPWSLAQALVGCPPGEGGEGEHHFRGQAGRMSARGRRRREEKENVRPPLRTSTATARQNRAYTNQRKEGEEASPPPSLFQNLRSHRGPKQRGQTAQPNGGWQGAGEFFLKSAPPSTLPPPTGCV